MKNLRKIKFKYRGSKMIGFISGIGVYKDFKVICNNNTVMVEINEKDIIKQEANNEKSI